MKTKEENRAYIKTRIVETDAEIDSITGHAVQRRDEKTTELIKLSLGERMRILNEIPLFTAEEYDRLNELRVQRSGLSDSLERFFEQTFRSAPDEDEPLY